ncbi:NAD-binding protein [Marinobacter xestospongiae]|uniref:NAD-binding protein n=1 Tax=Marinobacter xestospongiae TaxID=994319 RepID=A0ABU3VSK5_9GAMM|nr:NAD-binding protein [Marinobacter xestospongiae]MDV2077244.1 NAD-binding protein [Marinobacter xestospongiae]
MPPRPTGSRWPRGWSVCGTFCCCFFFIELGATLDLSTLGAQLGASVVFSVFVLVGNPIIVMGIMGYMGYRRRTGFLAGLTVAQISEFSLILAALGLSLGHLQQETAGLITLVGLITISASTYMILYSHALYEKLAPWLTWFERDIPHRELENQPRSNTRIDVLLIGLGRYGAALAANLRAHEGCGILAVDFDPSAVQQHMREGYSVHYGDAEDPEFVATLPLTDTRWVVSTIRDLAINKTLLHGLERQHYTGKVAIACSNRRDAEKLEQAGVDLVLIPYSDAAREAADQIMHHGSDDNTGGARP